MRSFVCYLLFFCQQKTSYEVRISDWSSDVCSADLVHGVCYQTAAELDARGNLFVNEVEWHLDVNLLGGADALKVDVLNAVAYWVQLIVTQQYLLLLDRKSVV